MTTTTRIGEITGGVDTHGATHYAAAIDQLGGLIGDREFPADAAGYRRLLAWLRGHGPVAAVGVEGTGSYGAGLARHLTREGVRVVEVDRPDRKTRRRQGKSDPLDAIAAARAVQSGTATGTPKTKVGAVEAIRALRVARRGAVKARTAAINQLKGLLVTAPEALRAQLAGLGNPALVARVAGFRPGADLADPTTATKFSLRSVGRRIQHLDQEIADIDQQLVPLVARIAPKTTALYGVGTQVAAQLLVTAGDNPERLRNEGAFAHLCGTAPLPATSGQIKNRHRLNRGGDRQANNALHTTAIVRIGHDPRTRAYVERRTKEGLSTKDIIRCLKRYIAREVHNALLHDLTAKTTT